MVAKQTLPLESNLQNLHGRLLFFFFFKCKSGEFFEIEKYKSGRVEPPELGGVPKRGCPTWTS
jgi:hypothetical protein